MPPINPPSREELLEMLGEKRLAAFEVTCRRVEELYEMDTAWNTGGKKWDYEYKYRRGGKTLCAVYARKGVLGFLVVLGRAEQQAFEEQRAEFLPATAALYDGTKVFHDGRWLMLDLQEEDEAQLADVERLLRIKRRPNKK